MNAQLVCGIAGRHLGQTRISQFGNMLSTGQRTIAGRSIGAASERRYGHKAFAGFSMNS